MNVIGKTSPVKGCCGVSWTVGYILFLFVLFCAIFTLIFYCLCHILKYVCFCRLHLWRHDEHPAQHHSEIRVKLLASGCLLLRQQLLSRWSYKPKLNHLLINVFHDLLLHIIQINIYNVYKLLRGFFLGLLHCVWCIQKPHIMLNKWMINIIVS